MRIAAVAIVCLFLSGCAYYLSPRPPIMERKLGRPGAESVGALATSADYRVIYVRVKPDAKLCAEPPPDAAGQFAATFAAALSGPLKEQTLSAEAQASMALSMKQLFQRSQGVQFYRDGTSTLCNMYLNGVITPDQYLTESQLLRVAAQTLILAELPTVKDLKIDTTAHPNSPPVVWSGAEKPKPAESAAAKPAAAGAMDADVEAAAAPEAKK